MNAPARKGATWSGGPLSHAKHRGPLALYPAPGTRSAATSTQSCSVPQGPKMQVPVCTTSAVKSEPGPGHVLLQQPHSPGHRQWWAIAPNGHHNSNSNNAGHEMGTIFYVLPDSPPLVAGARPCSHMKDTFPGGHVRCEARVLGCFRV